MLRQIEPATWKVLRAAKRAQPGGALGRDLRVVPTRKTKDGTFLDALVEAGLLEVRGTSGKTASEDEAVQFQQKYALTERGEHAAEFGEFEVEMPGATLDTPVTGLMGELYKTLAAARKSRKK